MGRNFEGRRRFLGATAAALAGGLSPRRGPGGDAAPEVRAVPEAGAAGRFFTEPEDFGDVSRGNPRPFTLRGEALDAARLSPEAWRLEVLGDGTSKVARPLSIEAGGAIDLPALEAMGKKVGVTFVKAIQCNNIAVPLGQGLWEGVPLRDVVRLAGEVSDVRRVYYSGFHNNDPAQLFRSSLAFNRVMETPPWEPPAIVAYRLNGGPIPLIRGGPVRMIIPWAHGFKSIKWLQRISLTNDYQANDTYALQNNDPESYLKTAAYPPKGPLPFRAGEPVVVEGTAMVGWSGLKRVEAWVRPAEGEPAGDLPDDHPAWATAAWRPCELMPPPEDWSAVFPAGTDPRRVWGFDPSTGRPRDWPLLFGTVPWTARLGGLAAGVYEFRARTVDLNGFAQPQPRPYQKSGRNRIASLTLNVTA